MLVACGVLALRHEANHAHVRDAFTGVISHAARSNCHDTNANTHVHSSPDGRDRDLGPCSLTTASIHQASESFDTPPLTTLPPIVGSVGSEVVRSNPRLTALLLVAPKTSPPQA